MSLAGPLLPRHRTTKRDERWRPFLLAAISIVAVLFQVLLLNTYHYMYWGSAYSPRHWADHDFLLRSLAG